MICEIPTNFGQASEEIATNIAKCWRCFLKNGENIIEIRDEKLLIFLGRRGAKECNSDRSRQELSKDIWLRNWASIQLRTSPLTFAK